MRIRDRIAEEVYATGGTVDILATIIYMMLLAGFLTAVFFYVSDPGSDTLRRNEISRARQLWSFAVALLVSMLLGLVPLLGQLLLFALMPFGTGALKFELYRAHIREPRNYRWTGPPLGKCRHGVGYDPFKLRKIGPLTRRAGVSRRPGG